MQDGSQVVAGARTPRWISTAPLAFLCNRRHGLGLTLLLAGSALVAVPLFHRFLFGRIVGDHDVHVGFIQRGAADGVWPVHFLFHAIVYGLSGFSHDFAPLAWAALLLLTMCVFAKALLTYAVLVRHCPRLETAAFETSHRLSQGMLLMAVTAALLVSAPIMRPWWTSRIYLGQISPNIWHNPTCVLCWPLVILLFFAADAVLHAARPRDAAFVGLLAFISVLAKPNYFLAFAPAYGLLAVRRFGVSRTWLLSQAALLPTVVLLWWQLTASFDGPNAMRPDRHIAWMPLAAWRVYSTSIPLSLLFSLAFPLSYLMIFRSTLQNRRTLLFAWCVTLSALAWTSCFAEVNNQGAVDEEFNFSWGSHLSLYVLFLVTAMDLIENPAAKSAGQAGIRLARLPWWMLGAHATSGIVWIVRQAIGKGFG